MANRRMISGDVFEDDFFGTLNFLERLLWIGLITSVADDQGRMMDNTVQIKAKVFLFDRVHDSQVETALAKCDAAGKIARYLGSGKLLIQIINWWKYQTPAWASPSKYPAPDGWIDRIKYHATGNKILTSKWDSPGGYIPSYVANYLSNEDSPEHSSEDRPIEERRGEEGEYSAAVHSVFPASLDCQEFREAWSEWETYRKQIKKKLTPISVKRQIAQLEKYAPPIAAAMLAQSITHGWTGIFELKEHGNSNGNGHKGNSPPEDTYFNPATGTYIRA